MGEQEPGGERRFLTDQVALITGAAHGIGRGIALEMAKEGAKIVVADISRENALITARQLTSLNAEYLIQTTDIRREKDHQKLLKATLKKFGRVDILVNDAAVGSFQTFRQTDPAELQKIVATNLTGTFLLTKTVAEAMIKSKTRGKILFITSIHDHVLRRYPNYSATKAAQAMMVREFAQDLAPFDIRVNGIAPGAIDTNDQDVESGKPIIGLHIPLGKKSGLPQDVARMAVVLVSDYWSRYMTGEIVKVDGGLSDVNWLTSQIPLEEPGEPPSR